MAKIRRMVSSAGSRIILTYSAKEIANAKIPTYAVLLPKLLLLNMTVDMTIPATEMSNKPMLNPPKAR